MNQEKLNELLHAWQLRLGLRDWDISAKLCHAYEMSNCWGEISWNLHEKIADIKVRYPGESPSHAMRPYDLEATLIHELLHIHFAPFDEVNNLAEEQAINALSKALVNLGRIYVEN
ncbi:hypothetical protein CAL7716_085450 [Calothrix sp. PCC 7716]|nr:hypothetical protein CAL7716_085450 [Calothrix sp. PCC 7716]